MENKKTIEELNKIIKGAIEMKEWAEKVLDGEADGYDGADGEREAVENAEIIIKLAAELIDIKKEVKQ